MPDDPRDDLIDEAPPPDPTEDGELFPAPAPAPPAETRLRGPKAAPPAALALDVRAGALPPGAAASRVSPSDVLPAVGPAVGRPIAESDEERILKEELKRLERWARENGGDARMDRLRYWSMKVPAVVCAAGTAVLQQLGYGDWVVIAGSMSAVLVAVDGLVPGGQLFKAHRSALLDLRMLENEVVTEWNKVVLKFRDQASEERRKLVLKILERIQKEKKRINEYLREAESQLVAAARPAETA